MKGHDGCPCLIICLTHSVLSYCSVMWWISQEIIGVKGCYKMGVLVVMYGTDAQILVIFLFWGAFVYPSENLLHPLGCYMFASIWAASL